MNDDYHDDSDENYEEDGWAEEEFDYDLFIADNFSDQVTNTETKPFWRLVSVLLLLVFGLSLLIAFSR